MSAEPLRVVVAVEELLVREGIQRILDQSGRVELVEGVGDLPSLDADLDSGLVREVLAGREGHVPMLASLTPREHETLALMAEGKSNAAIAEDLAVTSRAVERHVGSIFAKLQLRDTPDVSRRVMAVLSYLADAGGEPAR